MKVAIVATVVAVVFGIAAPTATADDISVYGAYVSRDADFAKLGKQVWRGLKIWNRSGWDWKNISRGGNGRGGS